MRVGLKVHFKKAKLPYNFDKNYKQFKKLKFN